MPIKKLNTINKSYTFNIQNLLERIIILVDFIFHSMTISHIFVVFNIIIF